MVLVRIRRLATKSGCYEINKIIKSRNNLWENHNAIPNWVSLNDVALDQFFTKKEVAKELYSNLIEHIKLDGISIDDCIFIEPSAGEGSFYDLLPNAARIGIDILPMHEEVQAQDFLSWELPPVPEGKKIVFVGNPPFSGIGHG